MNQSIHWRRKHLDQHSKDYHQQNEKLDKERNSLFVTNRFLATWTCERFMLRNSVPHVYQQQFFDLAQDGLLRSCDYFDPTIGIKFSTYACRAIMMALDKELKRIANSISKKHNTIFSDLVVVSIINQVHGADNSPDDNMVNREITSFVRGAVDNLSIDDQELIILRFWHDKTLAECAEILGCSCQNVQQQLRSILLRLRDTIESHI